MKGTFTRLVVGVALTAGSTGALGVLGQPSAHALGPEGCVAQGANGFLAVGTLTGTSAPAPPNSSPPAATCTFAALSGAGGFAGGDQVSWSVTVDTAHAAAKDLTGQPCSWVANALTGKSTWSGKNQAVGGVGCILSGGSGSATVG